MAIDVEGLRGPEHQEGEEIGSRDKCDDECQRQDAGILLQPGREHRVFGSEDLPEPEGNQKSSSNQQWDQGMC